MKITPRSACTACLILLAIGLVAGTVRGRISVQQPKRSRESDNAAVYASINKIQVSYRRLVKTLLGRIESNRLANCAEAGSIYSLGYLRAIAAVPELLKRVAFANLVNEPKSRIVLGYLWGMYPAKRALISIGMPSVRAILKVLPTERSALRRKLMVQVLVGVEGRAVTKFRLRRLIAKATTAAAKTDLEAALRDVPPPPHLRAGHK